GLLLRRRLATVVIAAEDDRDVVADAALHAVARAIDDLVADPHGRRAAAVEVHCRTNAEFVSHEIGELREREAGDAGAPAVGYDEIEQRAIFGNPECRTRMRR